MKDVDYIFSKVENATPAKYSLTINSLNEVQLECVEFEASSQTRLQENSITLFDDSPELLFDELRKIARIFARHDFNITKEQLEKIGDLRNQCEEVYDKVLHIEPDDKVNLPDQDCIDRVVYSLINKYAEYLISPFYDFPDYGMLVEFNSIEKYISALKTAIQYPKNVVINSVLCYFNSEDEWNDIAVDNANLNWNAEDTVVDNVAFQGSKKPDQNMLAKLSDQQLQKLNSFTTLTDEEGILFGGVFTCDDDYLQVGSHEFCCDNLLNIGEDEKFKPTIGDFIHDNKLYTEITKEITANVVDEAGSKVKLRYGLVYRLEYDKSIDPVLVCTTDFWPMAKKLDKGIYIA